MKKRVLICLFILAVVCITGCGKKSTDYKLQIVQTDWSGWSKDYKPEEKTSKYDIELDKEYEVGPYFTFKVTKINKNSIVIKTTEAFSDSEKGIDLNTKKKTFTVYNNKEIELTTPTMDAGYIYRLKLVK